MNATLFYLTCALAVLLPVLSIQIPRFIAHQTTDRISEQSNVPPLKPTRRPWDPPFPTSSPLQRKRDGEWLVPPRPDAPASTSGNERTESTVETRSGLENSTSSPPTVRANSHVAQGQSKINKSSMKAILWVGVAASGGVLLLLATTVFIVHLLAWFIVYKTEARLGEARTGLLVGGEMRLCLCGR